MRAVVTVIGKDQTGILAGTSTEIYKANGNIVEVSQSVLQDFFAMIMLVDITKMTMSLEDLQKKLRAELTTMDIHVMHEDIFNSMHRI